jgi:hypothetical protein
LTGPTIPVSAGMENPAESPRGRDRLCRVDNPTIVLRAVEQPVPGTRAIFSFDSAIVPPVIVGRSPHARDLTCGKCCAVLVKGVMPEQFARNGEVVAANPPKLEVPIGKWPYAERIEISQSDVVIADGGLVIQCPACQQFNEI